MKKLTLTLLMVIAFIFGANAQKDVLNPSAKPFHAMKKAVIAQTNLTKGPVVGDFEGTFPPIGWTLTAGTGDWAQSADVDHTTGTGNSAIYDCYNINGTAPAYLQTPEMTVTSGDVTFSFWCNYYLFNEAGAGAAGLYVDQSIDGGATWTAGTTNYLATITKDTWTQFTIDLTANIGQNVTLRFKAVSDWGYYNIAIDDVAGPAQNLPAHDLGITSITPVGHVLTGSTVIPHVTVTNFGAADEAAYSVLLSDGVGYNQTVNVSTTLLSIGNADLTFPAWTPADANYTLTATVTVTGDVDATNNSLTSSVQVRPYQFGDIVMEFNAQTGSAVGIETDGTNIYVQSWSSAVYERYSMDGTYINNFTIAAASSARDLAYDGTNFYGAPNTTSLFKLDFTAGSEALVSTITAPQACRAIAYDSDDNTFWGNSGAGVMKEFSNTGVLTGRTFTPSVSIYGAAYDNLSNPATPTIWGSDWSGGLARLVEWNLDGTATGRVVDLTSHFTTADAGGLAIYEEGNTAYLLADFQTAPTNTIVKIYLANTTSTDATLSDLTSGGATVAGFAATTYTYNVELPFGTTVVPTVTATTTDANATEVITPATVLPGATTILVTAQDGTTQLTYTINYTVAPASTIATLSDLTSGGATVAGFAATTYTYNVELPFGTTVVPTVTATTTDANATEVITPAIALPGATTIVVTAEDGTTQQTYTINYTVAATVSTDATLSDLTSGGTTVAGFAAATYTYNVVLPYGTTVVPAVTATTTNTAATKVITLATALPGATTVVVTAQDGTTQLTYTINYTIAPASTIATLSDLTSGGTTVAGFAATTYVYNVVLPAGTTVVPTVTATTTDANATKVITPAASLPGATTVVVTAEDGTTQQTYTINYTVAVQTYTVTFSVVGTNGTLAATVDAAAITSPATVNAGKNVVFTATPAVNYSVKEWKLNGTVVAGNTTNTYTLSNLAANATVTVEFKLNVGVNEATQNVVSIYPNPANDVVNVKMNNTIHKIAVVNMNGQVVAESVINNLEGSINTSSIANGMYFLRIETANGITMNKIQIVK